MEAIIKSMKTWATLAHARPLNYDGAVVSNDNSVFTVTFAPDAPIKGYEGQWLCIGRKVWVIKSIKPGKTAITVTANGGFSAFYRSHGIGSASIASTGAFLYDQLTINYKNQPDTEYAMPYLNITNTDETDFIQPNMVSDSVFVMSDYLRLCATMGVMVRIESAAAGSGLDVKIETRPDTARNLVFGDGHSELTAEDYAATIISKVTAVKNGVQSYYYLQADGSISQTAPNPRIDGQWQTIVIGDTQTAIDEVTKAFAKNTASLKIEFNSDKLFSHGELVRFRGNGKTQTAAISSVAIKYGDDRYYYKAGDLPTTLVDILKLALNK